MPRAVPGHFLTLNPAFLIDLMIGHKTLACQASTEGCWGNTLRRIQSSKCWLPVWMGTGWDDTEVHCLITSWQRPLLTWELYKHYRYTKYHQGLPSIIDTPTLSLRCMLCQAKPTLPEHEGSDRWRVSSCLTPRSQR